LIAPDLLARQSARIDDDTACIDQATLGGLGSAVTDTGFSDVFLAVPDRGPSDVPASRIARSRCSCRSWRHGSAWRMALVRSH